MTEIYDPRFQRRLTVLFVIGYFAMIFVFLACGAALFMFDDLALSADAKDVLLWLMATLGPLLGLLSKSLADQLQYHYGSSTGSKMKEKPEP